MPLNVLDEVSEILERVVVARLLDAEDGSLERLDELTEVVDEKFEVGLEELLSVVAGKLIELANDELLELVEGLFEVLSEMLGTVNEPLDSVVVVHEVLELVVETVEAED